MKEIAKAFDHVGYNIGFLDFKMGKIPEGKHFTCFPIKCIRSSKSMDRYPPKKHITRCLQFNDIKRKSL